MSAPGFFVTGGTLRHDAQCYVERTADRDLLDNLARAEFCYVLTSRQMGKSSLMVRTASRLRQQGFLVAVLDLTSIGQNVTAEQWYGGLLGRIGSQTRLEDELEDYWDAQTDLGPLQRFMSAIQEVILKQPESGGNAPEGNAPRAARSLVVFVDEIDAVRSLSFPSDEFFAAIKECYNRRAAESEFHRLTFCLLGVATPPELIRDPKMTPFNIGRRIELLDFNPLEAEALVPGLNRGHREGTRLLKRILYWTNGHPYLTQMLCQAIAAAGTNAGPVAIDRFCEQLFLGAKARDQDDNLLFVREWLLRSPVPREGLLDAYLLIHGGGRVVEDMENNVQDVLRLAGVVRVQDNYLRVRNRVYHRVFNQPWVLANHPTGLQRAQRATFKKGVIGGALAAAVVLAVGLGVLWVGWVAKQVWASAPSWLAPMTLTNVVLAGLPPRPAAAAIEQLDLTAFYNRRLSATPVTTATADASGASTATGFSLGAGLKTIEGVTFDARGAIAFSSSGILRMSNAPPAAYVSSELMETSILGVGRAATRLHLLHGTIHSLEDGAAIGRYTVHYADGQSWQFPIKTYRDIWSHDTLRISQTAPNQKATPAWTGSIPGLAPEVRVFVTSLTNPLPHLVIKSISLRQVSASSKAGMFLLAITLDVSDAPKLKP